VPFFYSINNAVTSNGSANTETNHLRLLTVANQESAKVVGVYGACRHGTAGGAQLRFKTFATASTTGTTVTPAKRHPSYPAASTTAFAAPTEGATPSVRLSVGMAQTGGTGGWVALEPAAAITLLANGGANGNGDLYSIAAGTSVPIDYTLEFSEG
jgi:hypothetical protein